MFDADIYKARRSLLRRRLGNGLVLLVGASESPRNFRDNPHPFVQDGSFSYFFGLRVPDLIGVLDLDTGEDWLFGDDGDLESVVWHGALPTLSERAEWVGIARSGSIAEAASLLRTAAHSGRAVDFLPAYRSQTLLRTGELLQRPSAAISHGASLSLIKQVVALRELKSPEEIAEMEAALAVTTVMHRTAMTSSRPGVLEREVVGEMEGIVRRKDLQLAYNVIFTKRGEILHNFSHGLRLEEGDLVVNDCGAASAGGYASDITRTLPIGGLFTPRQRMLYDCVLASQSAAIGALRPGVPFVDAHKLAMAVLVEGLAQEGVFRGDAREVVESGAYAVVCQGGLGHQIGLDVHDMEGLGEDHVGYNDEFNRSTLFGLNRLRLGKRLKAGMTVTVEPGLYFIAPLIECWAAQKRFSEFINYDRLRSFIGAGGLRIEDDVLVTETGARILGPPIPRTAEEVEEAMAA